MHYTPVTLTNEQRKNLETLATFLEGKAKELAQGHTDIRFDMRLYSELHHGPANPQHECGTVACACGHGPMAGIQALPEEGWREYEGRVFGGYSTDLHMWMFSASWARVDNTIAGAAKRIRIALEKGIPLDFVHRMHGSAELYPECQVENV